MEHVPKMTIAGQLKEINPSKLVQGYEEIDVLADIECCDCRRNPTPDLRALPALIKLRLVTMDVFVCAFHAQTRGVF